MNRLKFLSLLLGLTFSLSLLAQTNGHNNLKKGVALSGYDLVSYFESKKPIKGKEKYAVKRGDATFYFSSEANKKTYLNNPQKYQVVYGGWCAYAIGATGEKVEIDPLTYKIIDGKLYLYYNKYFNNTLDRWNKDEVNLKNKAEKNWQKIIGN